MASSLTRTCKLREEKSRSLYFLFFFLKDWLQTGNLPLSPLQCSISMLCAAVHGELYLICDRIILLFSLHLVDAGDIALEWENHWLAVKWACVFVHECMCAVKGSYVTTHSVHGVAVCRKLMRRKCLSLLLVHATPPQFVCLNTQMALSWDVCTSDFQSYSM